MLFNLEEYNLAKTITCIKNNNNHMGSILAVSSLDSRTLKGNEKQFELAGIRVIGVY